MKLISRNDFKLVEAHLVSRLEQAFVGDSLASMYAVLKQFVMSGGKRLRPQLCVWVYRHLAEDDVLLSSVLDLACVWEMFHAFLLAHDDIIDHADLRRGQPSLQRSLAALDGGSLEFGESLAMVAGDLLFTAAMDLLHDLNLPARPYRQVLKLFSRIARTTGLGQALDICHSHVHLGSACEQTLLREYDWKTAAYTFEGPMLSGAIVANANQCIPALSRFALALGQAYQLQNDVNDLFVPAHHGCDLLEGKRTVALLRGRANMPIDDRQNFDARLAALKDANGHSLELAEALRQDLINAGAISATSQLIDRFLAEAHEALGDAALPAGITFEMDQLLNQLREDYFVTR